MAEETSPQRKRWEAIAERFDPEAPARTEWRSKRPYSPAAHIGGALDRPTGAKRYIIVGTVGSGKSTELLTVAETRTQKGLVIFLDVFEHFQRRVRDVGALQRVQPWEILTLIGLSVFGAAQQQFGHPWSKDDEATLRSAIEGFSAQETSESSAQLDLPQLASQMIALAGGLAGGAAGSGLVALSAATKTLRWSLPLGLRERSLTPDQDQRVQVLLLAVNRLIARLQTDYYPLTLIIDGLDRITEAETARNLFTRSTLLGSLQCATVLTGPLSVWQAGLSPLVRHFDVKPIENIPVLDQTDPTQHGPGMAFYRSVFQARTQDLEGGPTAVSEPLLDRLAYYSGGHVREFIRLVAIVADRAWADDAMHATETHVENALRERRKAVEGGVHRGHLDMLRKVMDDPHHELPSDPLAEEALERWWLLPYPNESTWYYPHPLLTLVKLRR